MLELIFSCICFCQWWAWLVKYDVLHSVSLIYCTVFRQIISMLRSVRAGLSLTQNDFGHFCDAVFYQLMIPFWHQLMCILNFSLSLDNVNLDGKQLFSVTRASSCVVEIKQATIGERTPVSGGGDFNYVFRVHEDQGLKMLCRLRVSHSLKQHGSPKWRQLCSPSMFRPA